MTVVFVTNYYNHHQSSFARAMDEQTAHNFFFIETEPIDSERKQMGWGEENIPSFVLQSYRSREEEKKCQKLIIGADAVIWGSCPISMVRGRLKAHKLTFAYSERLFKKGFHGFSYWGRVLKYYFRLRPYQKNHYLLCASAYAAEDYARIGLFKGRAYQWGYFPEVKHYESIDRLIESKEERSLLWVGRLISWKHPELAIEVARKLREENVEFDLKMIGCGEMENTLRHMICEYHLENCVHLLGAMKPEAVRGYMEKAQVFLFTSDQNEGWGAVLNEAMNSACAVVANNQIGSVPYLVYDMQNGLIYHDGDSIQLFEAVKLALINKDQRICIGIHAYHTLVNTWNAVAAAERLRQLIADKTKAFSEGPMRLEKR